MLKPILVFGFDDGASKAVITIDAALVFGIKRRSCADVWMFVSICNVVIGSSMQTVS